MRRVWYGGVSVLVATVIAAILLTGQIPAITAAPSVSNPAFSGSSATCNPGQWTNSPRSYAYAWKLDGATVPGETTSSLDLAEGDEGKTVACVVTATNPKGSGGPAESSELTVFAPSDGNLWVVAANAGAGCARSGTPGAYSASTDCSFGDALTLAQDGDVLMFRAGLYGWWSGTTKAVTLRAQAGQHVVMGLDITAGQGNFTLDGGPGIDMEFNGAGGNAVAGTVHDITIRNSEFTKKIAFNSIEPDSGIVLDHNWHHGAESPCLICFTGGTIDGSGAIVRNSLLEDTGADGITTGNGLTVENNLFRRIDSTDPESHTDGLQGNGASELTVRGNLFLDCGDSAAILIGTFGSINNVLEHNVITNCGNDFQANEVNPLQVNWNTIVANHGTSALQCFNSDNITVTNNIAASFACVGLTTTVANSNNFTGTPTYVGGPNPQTFEEACLSPLSAGYTSASDGGQPGACGDDFTGGPPADWYDWTG